MSTIKSSTTLTTAYSVEADTTGALVIQTGATPTTAVTVSSAQVVTLAQPLPVASGGTGSTTGVTAAAVSDQNNTSTGYFDLPAGTTAQRPGSPVAGIIRYNTTESKYEIYTGTLWQFISTTGYPYNISYLVIAGGGGGGGQVGGGGGAGGYLSGSSFPISQGVTYAVTVGGGGTGGVGSSARGTNGGNSVFSSLTAIGGGAGGNFGSSQAVGVTGGSGGGGSGDSSAAGGSGTSGQGNAGGSGVGGAWGGGGGGGTSIGATGVEILTRMPDAQALA